MNRSEWDRVTANLWMDVNLVQTDIICVENGNGISSRNGSWLKKTFE